MTTDLTANIHRLAGQIAEGQVDDLDALYRALTDLDDAVRRFNRLPQRLDHVRLSDLVNLSDLVTWGDQPADLPDHIVSWDAHSRRVIGCEGRFYLVDLDD